MRFYRDLFLDPKIDNLALIKWRCRMGIGQTGIFFITLNRGADQLDIYPSSLFKQRWFRALPHLVVGLASSGAEALRLVEAMAEETYRVRGDALIKEYFLDMEPRWRRLLSS